MNLNDLVASQYANSPRLMALGQLFLDALEQAGSIRAFYDKVWNIQTAEGYGLDVWGRIVGVSRYLRIPVVTPYFGFAEAADVPATTPQPFDQAPFWDGYNATMVYALTDEPYRQLILVKAAANISDGSTKSINALLRALFGAQGRAYVVVPGPLQMQLTFEFTLSPVDLAILTESGAVPQPPGVALSVVQL